MEYDQEVFFHKIKRVCRQYHFYYLALVLFLKSEQAEGLFIIMILSKHGK